ncbi:hypothetical protein IMG5_038240 [Ichthyophthirius multifiliis]|uniref:Uncharacterized protein n=1 Tax=Ichthyophthirius multifiliis TaxID=5932 RepID=G0QLX2_ICHMU|nr:hypothetical protein IMG5_038240 [Ichthyophthirius multifiliis]EGR33778.1 hypothetical protein IMG5_038240 [Ichthyophthirius multifiliis]|eukprot:XP_004039002.1 hypothetical protein IMG5_038240 [Ichthyophthirius multifiliis]
MKRTKEAYFRDHLQPQQMQGCSGVKELEGEDLAYDSRNKYNKNQQKQWFEQQVIEKKQNDEAIRQEEQDYAEQTFELTRMRGMLEDDFNRKKAAMREQMKQENLKISREKAELQKKLKNEKLQYEQNESHYLQVRGQKRPFP